MREAYRAPIRLEGLFGLALCVRTELYQTLRKVSIMPNGLADRTVVQMVVLMVVLKVV
jgi:hypothetical protein